MKKFSIGRPSAPTVLSGLALFAALGGVGYAAGAHDGSKAQTLASGKTLKGLYAVGAFEGNTSQAEFADGVVSYPIPLKTAPTLHIIPEAGIPPAQCPGTPEKPKAKPGHLCVFEADGTHDSLDFAFLNGDATDKLGFRVEAGSSVSQHGFYFSNGTWAVTAP